MLVAGAFNTMNTQAHMLSERTSHADAGIAEKILIVQKTHTVSTGCYTPPMTSNGWPDEDIHCRAETVTALLAEILTHNGPVPHGGIND